MSSGGLRVLVLPSRSIHIYKVVASLLEEILERKLSPSTELSLSRLGTSNGLWLVSVSVRVPQRQTQTLCLCSCHEALGGEREEVRQGSNGHQRSVFQEWLSTMGSVLYTLCLRGTGAGC